MIHVALSESKIDLTRCYVIPIVNDENNARWFAHLKSMVPSLHLIFWQRIRYKSSITRN